MHLEEIFVCDCSCLGNFTRTDEGGRYMAIDAFGCVILPFISADGEGICLREHRLTVLPHYKEHAFRLAHLCELKKSLTLIVSCETKEERSSTLLVYNLSRIRSMDTEVTDLDPHQVFELSYSVMQMTTTIGEHGNMILLVCGSDFKVHVYSLDPQGFIRRRKKGSLSLQRPAIYALISANNNNSLEHLQEASHVVSSMPFQHIEGLPLRLAVKDRVDGQSNSVLGRSDGRLIWFKNEVTAFDGKLFLEIPPFKGPKMSKSPAEHDDSSSNIVGSPLMTAGTRTLGSFRRINSDSALTELERKSPGYSANISPGGLNIGDFAQNSSLYLRNSNSAEAFGSANEMFKEEKEGNKEEKNDGKEEEDRDEKEEENEDEDEDEDCDEEEYDNFDTEGISNHNLKPLSRRADSNNNTQESPDIHEAVESSVVATATGPACNLPEENNPAGDPTAGSPRKTETPKSKTSGISLLLDGVISCVAFYRIPVDNYHLDESDFYSDHDHYNYYTNNIDKYEYGPGPHDDVISGGGEINQYNQSPVLRKRGDSTYNNTAKFTLFYSDALLVGLANGAAAVLTFDTPSGDAHTHSSINKPPIALLPGSYEHGAVLTITSAAVTSGTYDDVLIGFRDGTVLLAACSDRHRRSSSVDNSGIEDLNDSVFEQDNCAFDNNNDCNSVHRIKFHMAWSIQLNNPIVGLSYGQVVEREKVRAQSQLQSIQNVWAQTARAESMNYTPAGTGIGNSTGFASSQKSRRWRRDHLVVTTTKSVHIFFPQLSEQFMNQREVCIDVDAEKDTGADADGSQCEGPDDSVMDINEEEQSVFMDDVHIDRAYFK